MTRVHKPWGWYETQVVGDGCLGKMIHVSPGARLSLQRHNHRSEMWWVVKGTAHVTVQAEDEWRDSRTVTEGSWIFIPVRAWHRLNNPDPEEELVVLEVQMGHCLEEDIERQDDDYGRS